MSLISLENRVGRPIAAGEYRLIPIERALQVQPPGMRTFLIWRRPASVLVQHPDGRDQTLEVPDLTRQAQIFLWGLALFIPLLIWLFTLPKQKQE